MGQQNTVVRVRRTHASASSERSKRQSQSSSFLRDRFRSKGRGTRLVILSVSFLLELERTQNLIEFRSDLFPQLAEPAAGVAADHCVPGGHPRARRGGPCAGPRAGAARHRKRGAGCDGRGNEEEAGVPGAAAGVAHEVLLFAQGRSGAIC